MARGITGGTRTASDGEGPVGRGWWAWQEEVWLAEKEQPRVVSQRALGDPLPSNVSSISLAVHPDGVRVASGQTAGVDKDGKVRPVSEAAGGPHETPNQLAFSLLPLSPLPAPAASGSRLGFRNTTEAAGDWTGGLREGCGGPGLFCCGELAPRLLDPPPCLGTPPFHCTRRPWKVWLS